MMSEEDTLSIGQWIYVLSYMFLFPVILFAAAGDWTWIEGWIYTLWWIALYLILILYLARKDPELLKERLRRPGTGGQKKWDKLLLLLVGIVYFLWLIIMPLDAKRYMWTGYFPLWLKITGGILLIFSTYFVCRSYIDNTFASALIRIQTERKQKVITDGIYQYIRHPMYLGAILLMIGTAMLLGSLLGILVALIMASVIVYRIFGEEKMLTNELEGYKEYKDKVKYRLIPFIW